MCHSKCYNMLFFNIFVEFYYYVSLFFLKRNSEFYCSNKNCFKVLFCLHVICLTVKGKYLRGRGVTLKRLKTALTQCSV